MRQGSAPEGTLARLFLTLIVTAAACGVRTADTGAAVSDFAASAAWKWESAGDFILRGRARLEGENQVFSGPFMVLASPELCLLRADFCGPDGSPLISIRQDTSGFLLYRPEAGEAEFHFGGIPVNGAFLDVNSVLSLLRTGFPAIPVPRRLDETWRPVTGGGAVWCFTAMEDTMQVVLEPSALFPFISTGGSTLRVTQTSWHDRFRAWPSEWVLSSEDGGIVSRIRTIEETENLEEARFDLQVPVYVDTFPPMFSAWRLTPEPQLR